MAAYCCSARNAHPAFPDWITHSRQPIAVSDDVLEDDADANEERLWRQ